MIINEDKLEKERPRERNIQVTTVSYPRKECAEPEPEMLSAEDNLFLQITSQDRVGSWILGVLLIIRIDFLFPICF